MRCLKMMAEYRTGPFVCGNSPVHLYYGMRKGKHVVVKREVMSLDPGYGEPAKEDLKEVDSWI